MEEELYLLSWQEVENGAKNILKQIKDRNLHIDVLLPILRGGAPLRQFIKQQLGG